MEVSSSIKDSVQITMSSIRYDGCQSRKGLIWSFCSSSLFYFSFNWYLLGSVSRSWKLSKKKPFYLKCGIHCCHLSIAFSCNIYILYHIFSGQSPNSPSKLSWHLGDYHNLILRIWLRVAKEERERDKNLKGGEKVLRGQWFCRKGAWRLVLRKTVTCD